MLKVGLAGCLEAPSSGVFYPVRVLESGGASKQPAKKIINTFIWRLSWVVEWVVVWVVAWVVWAAWAACNVASVARSIAETTAVSCATLKQPTGLRKLVSH